jgi:hypothetical protein
MSRMSENVGASTSRNPNGLHGLYGDKFTLFLQRKIILLSFSILEQISTWQISSLIKHTSYAVSSTRILRYRSGFMYFPSVFCGIILICLDAYLLLMTQIYYCKPVSSRIITQHSGIIILFHIICQMDITLKMSKKGYRF